MSEQGKPEPQPWMKDSEAEILADVNKQCENLDTDKLVRFRSEPSNWAEIIAKHYAASQPLVPQQEPTLENTLRVKLTQAHELLNRWGEMFNWKQWRTDTKHVPDEAVERLMSDTCGLEWDEDCHGYIAVKSDYYIDLLHKLRAGVPSEQGTTRCSYCNGPVLCTNCQVDRIKEFVEEISDPASEQGTPPQGQWVSVEERLPEFGGTYLVAVNGPSDDGENYIGVLPADWSLNDKRWHDLRGWGHNEVTHWRALPTPPSGEKT